MRILWTLRKVWAESPSRVVGLTVTQETTALNIRQPRRLPLPPSILRSGLRVATPQDTVSAFSLSFDAASTR